MADVARKVVACHALFLHERRGLAVTLGENGDQHISAGNLLSSGGLHVDHRALDYTLEASRRLRVRAVVGDQRFQLVVYIADEFLLQHPNINLAGFHRGQSVHVVDQCQEQMVERRVLVVAFVGERKRPLERLLETAGKGGHSASSSVVPALFLPHCSECWCLRRSQSAGLCSTEIPLALAGDEVRNGSSSAVARRPRDGSLPPDSCRARRMLLTAEMGQEL